MNAVLREIILASASPRRLALLRSLHLHVNVVKSAYDEPDDATLSPRDLAMRHAFAKLRDVTALLPPAHAPVVAADTVVDVDGIAYNKPRDHDDARRMLRDLSGRTHRVHTAVALVARANEAPAHFCETTDVTFFTLADDEIDAYVASAEPMDKAGAYGIQGYGATLVRRVDGDFYTVMGFPLARFARTLRQLGFSLPLANQRTEFDRAESG